MDITSPSRLDNISHFSPQATSTEQPHLPLFGGGITFDESLMPHQQVLDVFRQMQYSVPEGVYQQRPQNDSPENIQLRARMLVRENKSANDAYEEAKALRATRRTETLEDGRSHINRLTGLIDNIHTNYQKKYGELVKASTQYMQDMNTLASKLSRHMKAGDDGKIKFAKEHVLRDMDSIVSKYSGTSMEIEVLGETEEVKKLQKQIEEIAGTGGALEKWAHAIQKGKLREYEKLANKLEEIKKSLTLKDYGNYYGKWSPNFDDAKPLMEIKGGTKEYEFWEKKLTDQGFVIKQSNGKLCIYPDLKPVKEMFHAINHSSGAWNDGSDIMSQEFQSLQTAIDSQKNAINSSVSRLLETFRQDNSHFETLTQLLIQLYKDLQQYNNGYVNM
ncbi:MULTISPECIES: hypothetical protein [Providencia]|uniref:hypothetical protein n=1 Tax=Providencia TaxID=586 RepID=UPI0015ECC54B|nr:MULTISPECIES: hypothetical protein [Providencia]QLQ64834.1 hypothetical protein H0904_21150 [Providencia rettgeri]URR24843.1 hypothetical protein L3Q80_10750 [Providencia rettgeri]